MKRRQFLSNRAILSTGPLLLAGSAFGYVDDKKVYLDYSQQELDDAYSDARWAPNMRQLLAEQAEAGKKTRSRFPPRTVSYGSSAAERLDVFLPGKAAAGRAAMVFIHGGNWRFGSKESVSFLAPTFIGQDTVFIAPEFDSLPGNTLAGMVDQCRRAMAWVGRHAEELASIPAVSTSAGTRLADILRR